MGSRRVKEQALKFTILLITIFCFAMACSKHDSQETVNPYDDIKAKRAFYITQVSNAKIDTQIPIRCDRLTFAAMATAFGADLDLSAFEYSPGEWHRDKNICYPDSSRSEVSFDPILGVLHVIQTSQKMDMLGRLDAYAKRHNYIMGDGDTEFTYMPQIGLLMSEMRGELAFISQNEGTHRDHIAALSIFLRARYNGGVNSAELLALKSMKRTPIVSALIARYTDGDQSEALAILSDLHTFPMDHLPLETGVFSWGSCPAWVYFVIMTGILEGY